MCEELLQGHCQCETWLWSWNFSGPKLVKLVYLTFWVKMQVRMCLVSISCIQSKLHNKNTIMFTDGDVEVSEPSESITGAPGGPSMESWSNRLPTSLVQKNPSPSKQPVSSNISPAKSPASSKASSTEATPTKVNSWNNVVTQGILDYKGFHKVSGQIVWGV